MRNLFIVIALCLSFTACVAQQSAAVTDAALTEAVAEIEIAAPPWIAAELKAAVFPESLRPGEPFVAAVAIPKSMAEDAQASLSADAAAIFNLPIVELRSAAGKKLTQAKMFVLEDAGAGGVLIAGILAAPSTSPAGMATVVIAAPEESALLASGTKLEIPINIEKRDFPTETLMLSGDMADILTKPDPEKTRQAEKLWAILGTTGSTVYCDGNFAMPVVTEKTTSPYGIRRINKYPSGRTANSTHYGIDYRAREGTPISVCAPGRVALAEFRIVTGNTVVIEHLPGVYSECYHLSKIFVEEGQVVAAGDPLGEAGSTGFSTAAHLHWEVRVSGENADPEAFLGRAVLDKNAILDKLVSR